MDEIFGVGETKNEISVGKKLVGTGRTLPVFNYLGTVSDEKKDLVRQTGVEPLLSPQSILRRLSAPGRYCLAR